MSIYSALRAGVTGLNANSAAMAVIADNIANVQTPAFKRAASTFSALITGQSGGGTYNAGGVLANTRRIVDLQGPLEQTRSSTDLAINGDGFFIVTDDPTALGAADGGFFTRAGSFQLDEDGRLTNAAGYFLLGVPIDPDIGVDGAPPSSLAALRPIDLSNVGSRAVATTQITVRANLSSAQVAYPGRADVDALGNPITVPYAAGDMGLAPSDTAYVRPHLERTVEIYDSLGTVRTVSFAFLKTGPNAWQAEVLYRPDPDAAAQVIASGPINFNASGVADPVSLNWLRVNPLPGLDLTADGLGIQRLAMDLAGVTQNAQPSALESATANGTPPGNLVGVTVSRTGVLTAQFTNGRNEPLYRIPIATFLNPGGLQPDRGGAYRQTLESGLLTINTPGAGRAGDIQANQLEGSNVDLGTEFTNMITTQRAYSASSRVITTADEMLEELLQVVR